MNERYEQLLAQAHIEFAPDSKAVTARFAELIVRECADIDFYSLPGFGLYHEDRVHQVIKKHFGITE